MRFLRHLVYSWLCNILALWVADKLVDGIHFSGNFATIVIAALVFAFVNMLLKPIVKLLALPLIIITLGIALFFVNILMLYITDWIVSGFKIDNFMSAVWATIVIWAVNALLQLVFDIDDRASGKKKRAQTA